MAQPQEFKAYSVQSDGHAPAGLNVGDYVVTNGGLYCITDVIGDSYQSILVDASTTTYNYRGQYLENPNRSLLENKSSILYTDKFNMIDNYIYLYHVDKFVVLPEFPDSVQDSMGANFSPSTPLGRSAPIYSYKSSGPRTVQVDFLLHRELMRMINLNVNTSVVLGLGEDYVDVLIKLLQSASLPNYDSAKKMINPPIVAMRLGNDIFIKGIIASPISLTYSYPILPNNKYAVVRVAFTVSEMDPFDANTVTKAGSFRGLSTTLERAWSNYYQNNYDSKNNTIVDDKNRFSTNTNIG